MILETERLILRPLSLKDSNDLFNYRRDKETNKYQGWIPETIEETLLFINGVSGLLNIAGTWFQFAVVEKKSQKMIGDLGLHFTDEENKQVELGCTLSKAFQHCGYATEAVQCLLRYLFNQLGKHRIFVSIDPENSPSIRLFEHLGFRKEAHFKESLLLKEKWVDELIYALTEKDWQQIQNN